MMGHSATKLTRAFAVPSDDGRGACGAGRGHGAQTAGQS